jgi:benzylsuccinate CoA-transferase BbsE subunit
MADRALEGLRVVEFTDEIGSYAGKLLADLGAEVIKVEPPGGGVERHTPPFIQTLGEGPDTSITFWAHNTSKKSVVLDLMTTEGAAFARDLVLSADVVLEDNPVGHMAQFGLDYDTLRPAKPSLVYTSVTGFGQTGPFARYKYTDIVGQAMGGVMTLAGEPADPPNMMYGWQANMSASLNAAMGTLLAVLHADATGQGQLVDVSAQESLSMSQETAMQTWDLQKRNRMRTGEKGMIPVSLPGLGVYKAKDGFVALYILAPAGAEFPEFVAWMRELGMAEDLDQEPYANLCNTLNMGVVTQLMGNPESAASAASALTHINDVVRRFVATMSARDMYELGQRRRLLIGIVSTPKDLAENEQLRARNWYQRFDRGDGQEVDFPGPPYRLTETPATIGRPPRLGEHTDVVLTNIQRR